MRKLVRSSVLVALTLAATVVPHAAHAASYTPDSYAARLLTLFNAARQQRGLAPVSLAAGTTTVATAWTQHLAQAGALSHNPNLRQDLESHGSADWHVYGENVGDADSQDPDGLFDAYMASPEHRANILTKEFRFLGNAVVFAGGRAWNTMDLVDAYASSSTRNAANPAPVRVVRSAPKPVGKPAIHHVAAVAKPVSRPAVRPFPRTARVSRTQTRLPAALPRTVEAPASVRATHHLIAPKVPFDGRRVLLLAVAAMLVLQMGGLWVGCALRPRAATVRS